MNEKEHKKSGKSVEELKEIWGDQLEDPEVRENLNCRAKEECSISTFCRF